MKVLLLNPESPYKGGWGTRFWKVSRFLAKHLGEENFRCIVVSCRGHHVNVENAIRKAEGKIPDWCIPVHYSPYQIRQKTIETIRSIPNFNPDITILGGNIFSKIVDKIPGKLISSYGMNTNLVNFIQKPKHEEVHELLQYGITDKTKTYLKSIPNRFKHTHPKIKVYYMISKLEGYLSNHIDKIPKSKMMVIPHGGEERDLKYRSLFDERENILAFGGYAGWPNRMKNFEMQAEIINLAVEQGYNCKILGKFNRDKFKIPAIVSQQFYSDRKEYLKALSECKVFVDPSYYNPINNTNIEALELGLNVIVTPLSGTRYHFNTRIANPFDVEDFMEKISESTDKLMKNKTPKYYFSTFKRLFEKALEME